MRRQIDKINDRREEKQSLTACQHVKRRAGECSATESVDDSMLDSSWWNRMRLPFNSWICRSGNLLRGISHSFSLVVSLTLAVNVLWNVNLTNGSINQVATQIYVFIDKLLIDIIAQLCFVLLAFLVNLKLNQ